MSYDTTKANNVEGYNQAVDRWRQIIEGVIADPKELRRLALQTETSPTTFQRWVAGSTPRTGTLLKFLERLPDARREELFSALQEAGLLAAQVAVPGRMPEKEGEELPLAVIPSAFYSLALQALETSPDSLRYLTFCQLILREAIKQLDHERAGFCLTVVQCSPPTLETGKIHSLRERIQIGSAPWENRLMERPPLFLLDAQSLAGQCLASFQLEVVQDLSESTASTLLPHRAVERSAAAYPLLRAGRVAGCLVATSVVPNFFTEIHWSLLKDYTSLLTLALEPEEFYDRSIICLSLMPDLETQHEVFASLHDRVIKLMRQSERVPLTKRDAEEQVLREIEMELLQRR
jgi:hypothetical protein